MSVNDHTISAELLALAEIIRDDIDRAERSGRGIVNAYVLNYYVARLEALVKQADQEVAS